MNTSVNPSKEDEAILCVDERIKEIENLLIGPGADAFRSLEKEISVFCPFEAIGMVRQELRHAHFLSFMLNPHQPHPFGDLFLKTLLQEAVVQAGDGQTKLQPIEIYCSDCSNAIVYREKASIDLLIEVPRGIIKGAKGLLLAIELKIDASESDHQLEKYKSYVQSEYPEEEWDHIFVFLTKDATTPSDNNKLSWIPVSLSDLVTSFDQTIEERNFTGEAAGLYKKYSNMIRRQLMESDTLANLAKQVWAKHKNALDTLYEYRPDLQSDIFEWLNDNEEAVISSVKKATGLTLVKDRSSPRILRYSVKEWLEMDGFCSEDKSWVDTGAVLLIEVLGWGEGCIRVSMVLGPGDQSTRLSIYRGVLDLVDAKKISIGRRTSKIGRYKHLSGTDIQKVRAYDLAEANEEDAGKLGEKIVKRMTSFLKVHLPLYNEVLREVFHK